MLERLDAGRYSYLRLSTSSGEIWAAVPLTGANIGSEVAIENPMPMDGFETKTLNRKFDRIFFGTLRQPEGAETAKALKRRIPAYRSPTVLSRSKCKEPRVLKGGRLPKSSLRRRS